MFKEFLTAKYNMAITKKVMTRPTPKIVMTPGTSLAGNKTLSIRGINQIAKKLKKKNSNKLIKFFDMIFCIIASKNFCAKRASEGGAGIPFPLTPFPSRAARADGFGRIAKRLRRFAQNGFALHLEYPTIRNFANFALGTSWNARRAERRGSQGIEPKNPTARQTKRKPLFAS